MNSARDDKEDGYHSWGTSRVGFESVPFVLTLDCIVIHLKKSPLRTKLYANDVTLVAGAGVESAVVTGNPPDSGLWLNVKKARLISSEKCSSPMAQMERIHRNPLRPYVLNDAQRQAI